jgi:periplasmic protein TonB
MATLLVPGVAPARARFYPAAALALIVEAALLGAAFVLFSRTPPMPLEQPVTVLTIAPAPLPQPVAPAEPQPKPQQVTRPATPVRHVAHLTPPRPAPAPQPIPAPAPPSTMPTDPAPVPRAPPPPPSAPPAAAADPSASFEGALRAVIQAALRYPESARMASMAGRTRVAFKFRDGVVSDVTVVTSSGVGLLDRAALAAVRDAAYPKPEPAFSGKTLSEQLWVTFNLNDSE